MKVLIISHPPVSTYEAMGKTFLSLFDFFSQEELCQLYIHPNIPNVNKCNSYFRITDKDVLKSYFNFKEIGQEIDCSKISDNNLLYENDRDASFYSNNKNRMSFRILMRDLMWKFTRWDNKKLNDWVRKENPSCIFVAPGNAKFLYDMAIKLSKRYNLPIVTYVCDEYYFVAKPKRVLDKLRICLVKRKIRQLMNRTTHIVTICDRLSRLYGEEFSLPTTTIMTGTNHNIEEYPPKIKSAQAINYMGNIKCNRVEALVEIGSALKRFNQQFNSNFILNVYTNERDKEIIKPLLNLDTIKFCGFVTGEEFDKVFYSSDILLHTEAFDEKSIDLVKNSVSTKIADSLASGIPLLAYGPKQVASMEHLICNKCAITATSEEELYIALERVFFDEVYKKETVENALKTANNYHNSKVNSEKLYRVFNTLAKEI